MQSACLTLFSKHNETTWLRQWHLIIQLSVFGEQTRNATELTYKRMKELLLPQVEYPELLLQCGTTIIIHRIPQTP